MDVYLGQIVLFPYSFIPLGFLPCDGKLMPITQNTALYSLLGNKFGGDDRTTFGLPNYTSINPTGSTYCIAVQGLFPQRPERE